MENKEAKKYVWEGSIPLEIHLHDSEVTTLPPPSPAHVMAPRIGYLPLLIPQIKPYFSSTLPPGVDAVWFEYKGLPLKWYIPTGVLFDLLCAEPERPWKLTIHFRGYPANILMPCEGEDSVKWTFINSLKEAACIINGNCKNVMNMSQSDQVELWRSVMYGMCHNDMINMESYLRVSSKLKLGTDEGRIPVRLYVWSVSEDFDDLEDAPQVESWDRISYINRPVEIRKEGGYFSLYDALKVLLPEFFSDKASSNDDEQNNSPEVSSCDKIADDFRQSQDKYRNQFLPPNSQIKLVRIQGIEPKLEIPFTWVVTNLMHPEHYLHICVCVRVQSLE